MAEKSANLFDKLVSDFNTLEESLTSTANIDPQAYSPKVNREYGSRLKYSLAGMMHMVVRHQTVRALSIWSLINIVAGIWVGIDLFKWALLVEAVGVMWVTEFMNTAVEATVNLVTSEFHPMAKVAKDVASAAVFVSVIIGFVASVLVLGPPIVAKLGG